LNDVIAQEHDKRLLAQEIPAHLDRVSQTQRLILVDIRHINAPTAAPTHGCLDVHGGVTDDDADVADAGVTNGLDDAKENRFIGDGDQLFRAGERERLQASPTATAEDQTFHLPSPLSATGT
jgi:hypothetical protein